MRRWGTILLLIGLLGILSGCFLFTPIGPQLLYSEDFSNSSSADWPQETDASGGWQITNGRYYGMLADNDSYYYVYSGAATVQTLTDFRIQATTSQQGSATDHSWGLILRASDEHFYAFEISADGWYVFSVYTPTDWVNLGNKWQETDKINPMGQTNTLRVDARGNTFDLYINDQHVETVQDSTLSSGSVGFIVETWDDPNGGAWFDNLQVWSLVD
jgi:hypothetical protein